MKLPYKLSLSPTTIDKHVYLVIIIIWLILLVSLSPKSITLSVCWDARQCFVRQFRTDYVRLPAGLVFGEKNFCDR